MQAVIGVDPHKHVFSAVALAERGGGVGRWHGEISQRGTRALLARADAQVAKPVWAIQRSNNRGRQLALALLARGADVRDVCPTRTADRRQKRPGRGKSDAVDAEAIARERQAHSHLPHAFTGATTAGPDPLREELMRFRAPVPAAAQRRTPHDAFNCARRSDAERRSRRGSPQDAAVAAVATDGSPPARPDLRPAAATRATAGGPRGTPANCPRQPAAGPAAAHGPPQPRRTAR